MDGYVCKYCFLVWLEARGRLSILLYIMGDVRSDVVL